MGATTSSPDQTSSDVDAIIQGMSRAPPALDPNYRPPMPPQIQPRPAPASAFGNAVFGSSQPQSWPGPGSSYGTAPPPPPARSDDSGSGLTPSPYSNAPVGATPAPTQGPLGSEWASNRPIVLPSSSRQPSVSQPPPRFQSGNQPGPWPAAYPNSPQINLQNPPALPGETPQETAALNRFMGRESQGQNIINSVAAKDPRLYTQEGRTASGYWQMVNSTWATAARLAGVDTRQYPTAMSAPYQVQRQVALALYRSQGEQPWAESAENRTNVSGNPQQPLPPQPRGSEDWGSAPPRDFGPGPTGQQGPFGQAANMQPGQSGFTRVLNSVGPLLLGIASLALRLPLSTAITAYGAMARAQDNGQREAYERARTQFQDQLNAVNAQQTLESREASDAYTEYGNNNPQGLQQTLAQIALKYNDPVMYRMAERGDLNGIHQLQTKRDLYNQDLTKLNKAAQDEQDRQAENTAVTAMDHQWHDDFVAKNGREPTADETAIAHNQHIGEASKAGTKTDTSDAEEATIYNVLGPDKQPTGQQVRAGKQGGLLDVSTKQPVQLKPGETIAPETRGTAGGSLEATKPYDVVDKDGKVVRTVLGRERKDQPGILDSETGEPIKLDPGQSLQPHARSSVASPLETGKPFDIVDKDGHVVPGGQGVMLRERRDGAGYVYAETGDPLKLEPGQHVRQITPTTSGGGRAGAQVLRQLVGGREVLSDLQNVVRLPVGTTTGPLGQVQPGPTIAGALTGDLTRTLTDQDSQLMQASMASMERELSVLMSPVYGGNWAAQQISPLIPKSGDTIQTVMFKLSRLAQSADNALEAASKSPFLSNEEQEYAKDLRKQISEAIPWSTAEAMDFAYRGQPHETFGDYAKRQGIGGSQPAPPKIGDVHDGYRFKGGDPADSKNWEKQ